MRFCATIDSRERSYLESIVRLLRSRGRGACRSPHLQRPAAQGQWWRRHVRLVLRRADIERRLMASDARFTVLDEDEMIETTTQALVEQKGGWLVPGSYGVWAALARCALDPGRSALTQHAEEPQSQGQISRTRA